MVTTCVASVQEPGGWHSHICGRKGGLNEMGEWWCKTHAPSIVKAKQDVRDAAFRARMDNLRAERQAVHELARLRAAVARLADGVMKFGVHDCATVDELCALVPSDGSWETKP